MDVELSKETKNISDLLFDRMKTEEGLKPSGNNNNMDFSLNLPFDDESYKVSLGDAEITDGQLKVKDGFDSAIAEFRFPENLPRTVNQFEVISENPADFSTSIIKIATDNISYIEATQQNVIFSGNSGLRPSIQIRLNSSTAKLDGLVVGVN